MSLTPPALCALGADQDEFQDEFRNFFAIAMCYSERKRLLIRRFDVAMIATYYI